MFGGESHHRVWADGQQQKQQQPYQQQQQRQFQQWFVCDPSVNGSQAFGKAWYSLKLGSVTGAWHSLEPGPHGATQSRHSCLQGGIPGRLANISGQSQQKSLGSWVLGRQLQIYLYVWNVMPQIPPCLHGVRFQGPCKQWVGGGRTPK